MSANYEAAPSTGAGRTLDLVVFHVEDFQIYKSAEFLGQFSCQEVRTSVKHEAAKPGVEWTSGPDRELCDASK